MLKRADRQENGVSFTFNYPGKSKIDAHEIGQYVENLINSRLFLDRETGICIVPSTNINVKSERVDVTFYVFMTKIALGAFDREFRTDSIITNSLNRLDTLFSSLLFDDFSRKLDKVVDDYEYHENGDFIQTVKRNWRVRK